MNIKYPFRAICLIVLTSVVTCLSAQDKAAVILINSVPYNVLLSKKGDIKQIKGEATGHMKGFIRSADEFDLPGGSKEVAITSNLEEGAAVRSDRSMIDFEPNYATLADNSEGILNQVAEGFKLSSQEKVMISAFKSEESEDNSLYSNRIKTIRTYLELKGIPSSRILTEILVSSALKDKVSLTYIQ